MAPMILRGTPVDAKQSLSTPTATHFFKMGKLSVISRQLSASKRFPIVKQRDAVVHSPPEECVSATKRSSRGGPDRPADTPDAPHSCDAGLPSHSSYEDIPSHSSSGPPAFCPDTTLGRSTSVADCPHQSPRLTFHAEPTESSQQHIAAGEVAERPIAPVLKTGVPVREPRVRIPASPLHPAR